MNANSDFKINFTKRIKYNIGFNISLRSVIYEAKVAHDKVYL